VPTQIRIVRGDITVLDVEATLLALAAAEFDAFITVDKNLPYQQNLAALPIALIVLDSVSNALLRWLATSSHRLTSLFYVMTE
jgi:uncharacterized membrane protein YwzB